MFRLALKSLTVRLMITHNMVALTSPRSPIAETFPRISSPTSSSGKQTIHLARAPEEAARAPHAYRPPGEASRSPCPCLNALANHSYLPHDGRNITFTKIMSALQEGMGLSPSFSLFMAIGTFTLLRRPSLAPFDLYGASRHGFIEHNASMVHADALPGAEYAPPEVDPGLLGKFLAKAHPSQSSGEEVITGEDISDCRIQREAESGPVDALHAELGRAEFAMIMEIFGKGKDKELLRKDMEVFLGEERLPEGWAPTHTVQLWEAMARSTKIRHTMEKLTDAGHDDTKGTQVEGGVEWIKTIVERLAGHI